MSMAVAVNTLRRFCLDIEKSADFENLNRKQLNELLTLFYSDVQKVKHKNSKNINENEDYSKNTINQIRYGLYKYISSINSRIDIIHDPEFIKAEGAFKARLDLIDRKSTNVSQVIALKDVRRLYYKTAVFNLTQPVGLQCKVLFDILLYFCQGDKLSLEDMKQDSFKIETDHQGKCYVTNAWVEKSDLADRMYEVTGHRYCPVSSFKSYIFKLNPLCKSLWQQPMKLVDSNQVVWYDCLPLDVSVLNGMMAEISKNAKLSKIYKNEDVMASSPTLINSEIFKKKNPNTSKSISGDSDNGSESDDDGKESLAKLNTRSSANLPEFFPGTTWPLDATLELLINYEAVKEVRTVKKQFYPLLYHLTRTDYDSIANSLNSIKPLAELLKTRYTITKLSSTVDSVRTEAAKTETVSDGYPTRQASRIRQDTTIISDLQGAKKEVLKLFSRMSLKRQDFAKILCWVQKLDIKIGKSGDQFILESKNEKVAPSKMKGRITGATRNQKFEVPEPPKVSSRLRKRKASTQSDTSSSKDTATCDAKSATTSTQEKKKRGPKPREPSKSPITSPTSKSNFNMRISYRNKTDRDGGNKIKKAKKYVSRKKANKNNRGRKRKEWTEESSSVSENENEMMTEETCTASEAENENDRSANRKQPPYRPKSILSSTESESEKIANGTEDSSHDMGFTDYVPNKRFRIAEKDNAKDSEQTEIESIYLKSQSVTVPVPMCLYKVEADEPDHIDNDDDDMQVIESKTWFPPPQVEIENLEGAVIKKENESEVFEIEKETNFEPYSNSSSVITSSVEEPVSEELSNCGSQFPTVLQPSNDFSNSNSLSDEQINSRSGASNWNESLAHSLPQSNKTIHKSNRTCLGDVCLGEYCPHEHILVAKNRSSIMDNDDEKFVITQNSENAEATTEIIDSSEDESDRIISPSNKMSVLENSHQSPESTVHTSGNLACENKEQANSIQDISVKQEMTPLLNMDDGKEADPVIIIDDD